MAELRSLARLVALSLAPLPLAAPALARQEERPSLSEMKAALPFRLALQGTTTYQVLDGAEDARDYLVGYLDMVIEGELWEGTTAVVEWESVGGDGPDSDVPSFAATVSGWNANAGSAQDADGFDRFYLAEAFVSSSSVCDDWVVDLGKIASTSYLDTLRVANDSVGQFLLGSFCNAAAMQVPFRGGGLAASFVGSESCDFRALVMRPDNGADDPTSRVFGGAQLGLYWGGEARPGSCMLYGWSDGSSDGRGGVGLGADQDFGERLTAFGRVAVQQEDEVVPDALASSWSAGFELRDGFTGRESDLFAAAVGVNTSHDGALDDEGVFETYYRRVFNDHCEGSLHVQAMQHPGGDPDEDLVTALGLRIVFTL